MFYFVLGISLMLNLIFIIGFIKFYKKIFSKDKYTLLNNMQEQLNLAFKGLDKINVKEEKKEDNDLSSIFKTSVNQDDFWKI